MSGKKFQVPDVKFENPTQLVREYGLSDTVLDKLKARPNEWGLLKEFEWLSNAIRYRTKLERQKSGLNLEIVIGRKGKSPVSGRMIFGVYARWVDETKT